MFQLTIQRPAYFVTESRRGEGFLKKLNLGVGYSLFENHLVGVTGRKNDFDFGSVRDEIYAIFASSQAMKGVKIMDETGALSAVFPELDPARGFAQPPNHHYWDVFEHSVQAVGKADAILDDETR